MTYFHPLGEVWGHVGMSEVQQPSVPHVLESLFHLICQAPLMAAWGDSQRHKDFGIPHLRPSSFLSDSVILKYKSRSQRVVLQKKTNSNSPSCPQGDWSFEADSSNRKDQSGLLYHCEGAMHNCVFVEILDFLSHFD